MILLLIAGVFVFVAGLALAWLNLNTPFQTGCLPAVLLLAGGAAALFSAGAIVG